MADAHRPQQRHHANTTGISQPSPAQPSPGKRVATIERDRRSSKSDDGVPGSHANVQDSAHYLFRLRTQQRSSRLLLRETPCISNGVRAQ
jgi:hypothetical protein